MNHKKVLVLRKSLPSCPAGRLFLESIDGSFFHSMTNDECIAGLLKAYRFTKEEIDQNPSWFIDTLQVSVYGHDEVLYLNPYNREIVLKKGR